MKVSYFMLSQFSQCPLKYKYHYIDGLAERYGKARPYFSMGSSVHQALEDFFRIKEKKKRTLQNLHYLLRKNWIRAGYGTRERERKWGLRALEMLTNFYNTYDCYITPIMVERTFEAKLDGLILTGRIDRVDKLQGGSYEVIDYKTGKNLLTQEENLQLVLYSLGLKYAYGIEPRVLSFYFLQKNQKVSIVRTPELIQVGLARIKDMVQEIKSTEEFEARPNRYCGMCIFKRICPKYEHP